MLVYRIERNGHGPYTNHSWTDCYKLQNAHQESSKHPGICADVDGFNRVCHVCGFRSYKQLTKWFSGWMKRLRKGGFRVHVYEIPKSRVLIGKYQVAFDTLDTISVDAWPIVT